ncbi:universal stress protein [Alicyclobacillus fodiniaquatilis]|jgi:nucleotide-binding universal stress UspA family protein|uniref:Universal stress protein n=1 Tax=Alicyclobacillus fodiniaquatilis TaxID=1661150 RepID=A0ABW4JM21_9BACL
MKKILLATDGSEDAKKAGDMAASFLDVFPEATLVGLFVMHPSYLGTGMGIVVETLNDTLETLAKDIEQQFHAQFAAYADRVRFISEFGAPAISICETAKREGVDLIVIGSHGYGVVDRMLLGSVSNSVVHRSHISTLVVKS